MCIRDRLAAVLFGPVERLLHGHGVIDGAVGPDLGARLDLDQDRLVQGIATAQLRQELAQSGRLRCIVVHERRPPPGPGTSTTEGSTAAATHAASAPRSSPVPSAT